MPDRTRRWRNQTRAALRAEHLAECEIDPVTGWRINVNPACPHGTRGGSDNWRCQCRIVPGTERRPEIEGDGKQVVTPDQLWWPIPGCQPAKEAARYGTRPKRPEPLERQHQ